MTTETKERTDTKTQIQEPPEYNVLYHNDDLTTFDFVANSLVKHFKYSYSEAEDKTIEVDEQKVAVVATLAYELAEQKAVEVTLEARTEGFPFQVTIEPAG